MIQVVLAQPRFLCAGVRRNVRDICYATENRHQSVYDLAKLVVSILVVRLKNSSISSALETLVNGVIARLRHISVITVSILAGVAEDVKFSFRPKFISSVEGKQPYVRPS